MEGDGELNSTHDTRKPLAKGTVHPATVTQIDEGWRLNAYDDTTTHIWWMVTDAEELVALLLERNADHLRQVTADGTPFSTDPMKQLFGLYGTTDNTDKFLRGELDLSDLPIS